MRKRAKYDEKRGDKADNNWMDVIRRRVGNITIGSTKKKKNQERLKASRGS